MEINKVANGAALEDLDIFRNSPFLSYLVGDGSWRETIRLPDQAKARMEDDQTGTQSLQSFRRKIRRFVQDQEAAVLALRRFRVRTLLTLARLDLEGRLKPHQVRARLKNLSEFQVQEAWWLAETSLREKYVHPLILERRNINPPMAVCSLSRLGSGEPWYTTGPAPLFVHSRAAEFAPALTERDFTLARRSKKEWLPAREYFHRLARRTMSNLSVPDPGGKGFGHMTEDFPPVRPALLPGALVVLFSAFEEHFLSLRPVKERLSLMRLRFLVGLERLGRAVEAASRHVLLRTAEELGARLKAGINAWYKDRATAEGLPLVSGGLLDIERRIRLIQFRYAPDDLSLLVPSPLKAMDLLARRGLISGETKRVLSRAYTWQWFLANRLSLLGGRWALDRQGLNSGRLDGKLGLPGASARTLELMKSAQETLSDLTKETRRESAAL
ncbi:MAG: hypothetical protein V1742_07635 [Pseudomonadota bacterium]